MTGFCSCTPPNWTLIGTSCKNVQPAQDSTHTHQTQDSPHAHQTQDSPHAHQTQDSTHCTPNSGLYSCTPNSGQLRRGRNRPMQTYTHTCRCRLGLVGRHITNGFLQPFCLLSIPTLQRRLWMVNVYLQCEKRGHRGQTSTSTVHAE